MSYCDNCGCRSYNGACTNCHEEVYIREQYEDLEMEVPHSINKKIAEYQPEIDKNNKKNQ